MVRVFLIEGDIYTPYRKAIISTQDTYILSAVERRGYQGFRIHEKTSDALEYRQALEIFFCRERHFRNLEEGMDSTQKLVEDMCKKLSPIGLLEEGKDTDFTRQELQQTSHLGTVGLWVGLHGEIIFQAGLHHLAALFDFEIFRTDLKPQGINTMNPFSYFEFLKQAFTEGETWSVNKKTAG